jgi:hypothetical protein
MNWFRLYVDARNDAKLRTLTDAEHRVWFHLLCYSAEQEPRGSVTGVTSVTDVTSAFLLAIEVANGDTPLLITTVEKLLNLHILTFDDDGLTFINFRKRQYDKPSDTPEETRRRKAEQRERERATKPADVTPPNDASRDVTPSHATEQNRTDTEQNRADAEQTQTEAANAADGVGEEPKPDKPKRPQSKYPDDFETFWSAYPTGHGIKAKAYDQWQRIKPDGALAADIMAGLDRWKESERWENGYVKSAELWLRDAWWTNQPPPRKVMAFNGRQSAGAQLLAKYNIPRDSDPDDQFIDVEAKVVNR